jgi:hypothetical protein
MSTATRASGVEAAVAAGIFPATVPVVTTSWIDLDLAIPVVEDDAATPAGAAALAGAETSAGDGTLADTAWVATALPVVCWLASAVRGAARVAGPALPSVAGFGCVVVGPAAA